MGITYRNDPDLDFLRYCKENDLKILARYLTHDKDGEERYASELLENEDFNKYRNQPDQHVKAWKLIAGELQHFGGDTLINLIRGTGVLYKEILCDVCSKLDVDYNKEQKTYEIENNLFRKVFKDLWEKMSPQERANLLGEAGMDNRTSSGEILARLLAAIGSGSVTSFLIASVIARAVATVALSDSVILITNFGLWRGLAVAAGPIGWIVTTLITVPVITGPAYRVTVPSVLHVAYMRSTLAENDHF